MERGAFFGIDPQATKTAFKLWLPKLGASATAPSSTSHQRKTPSL